MKTWLAAKIAMGGYSAFVWPAYGLVALVLLGFVVSARRSTTLTRKRLTLWHRSDA